MAAAAGLRWAADHGAHVANLSFGGPTASPVLSDAIAYATGKGVTIVAAAGTQGTAALDLPGGPAQVIAVGAVRFDRTSASYSNIGTALDLVGPGGDLSVDQNLDSLPGRHPPADASGTTGQFCYCFLQGTSMASPHVAAVAALVVSRGVTAPAAVRGACSSRRPSTSACRGGTTPSAPGLVQALAAVQAADAGYRLRPPATARPRGPHHRRRLPERPDARRRLHRRRRRRHPPPGR